MYYEDGPVKEEQFDLKVKIMLIGDSNVGKTSILKRFCKNIFSTSYISTVGIDFENKYIKIGKQTINLQIWDTAGQERYKVLSRNYYNNSDAFMIVYDITNLKSFESVTNWIEQIKENASENVKSILIGNKSDLEVKRKIKTEEGKNLANKININFYETSAQNGSNIEKAISDLVKEVINDDNFVKEYESNSPSQISEEKFNKENKKKNCC